MLNNDTVSNLHKELGMILSRLGSEVSFSYDKDKLLQIVDLLFKASLQLPTENLDSDDPYEKYYSEVVDAAKYRAFQFADENLKNGMMLMFYFVVLCGHMEATRRLRQDLLPLHYEDTELEEQEMLSVKKSLIKKIGLKFMTAFIDGLPLPYDRGGRPKDFQLDRIVEKVFMDAILSDVEICQEDLEKFLSRKANRKISPDSARKRMIRKGKSVSELRKEIQKSQSDKSSE